MKEYFGDWLKVLPKQEMMKTLTEINKVKTQICPLYKNIFKAFTMFPLSQLRAVFIGQDPYSDLYKGEPRATGILFGNKSEELSPSLKVIKEAVIDFEIPHNSVNFDNSLESWAKQGILMLNSAMTCITNNIGSHIMIWRPFIKKLLQNLSNYDTAVVYVLFGEQAKTFKPYINSSFNHIITVKHPSYYARTGSKMPNVFAQVNKILVGLEGVPIIWYN